MCPAAYSCCPHAISRPRSPPVAPVEADVDPSPGIVNMWWVPQLVSFARTHRVPLGSASAPLPGTTPGQNIPPWWSVESKSLLDSTIATPRAASVSTTCRMNDE